MFFHKNETIVWLDANSNYTRTSLKQFYDLAPIHFEKANATYVAEHNIVSVIVLCVQKAASEAQTTFTGTNICELECY